MMIPFGETSTTFFFMICGILYCVACCRRCCPGPPRRAAETGALDLRGLYRNSPVSFSACLLIGIANGAFGTLGAGLRPPGGLSDSTVAGYERGDLLGRRHATAGRPHLRPVSTAAMCLPRRRGRAFAGLLIFLVDRARSGSFLTLIANLRRSRQCALPIAVSHANDFATPEDS